MLFQHSTWSEPGWPAAAPGTNVLRGTFQAIHVLFSLFYSAELNVDRLAGRQDPKNPGTYAWNNEILDIVCTVCAYAEYFQCGEKIKPAIIRVIQSAPGHLAAVANDPKRHTMFAIRLELPELYQDALRHLVAHAWNLPYLGSSWADVALATGKTEDEARAFFEPQMQRMPDFIATLDRKLTKTTVQLDDSYSWYAKAARDVHKMNGKTLGRWKQARAEKAAEFAARGHWNQFFFSRLHGDRPPNSKHPQ